MTEMKVGIWAATATAATIVPTTVVYVVRRGLIRVIVMIIARVMIIKRKRIVRRVCVRWTRRMI